MTQPYAQKDAAQYPSNPGAPYRRPLAGGGGGGTPIPTPREHARPYGQGASHHLPLRRDDGYPNRGGASGSGNYGNGNGYGNGHGGGHNSRAAPVYDDDLNARPNRAGGYGAGFNDSPAPWESDRDRAVARIAQDKADREARLATEAERKRNLAKQLERDQEQKDEKKRLNKEKDREARERAKLDKGDKTKAGDARLEDDQSPFDLTSDHKGKKKDLDAPVNGFYNGKSSLPKAHKDPDAVARREAANAAELRTQPPRKKAKVKQIAIDSDSDDLDECAHPALSVRAKERKLIWGAGRPTSSSRKRAVADSDDDEPVKGTKQKKKMRKLGGKDDRSKGKGKSRELSVEQLTIDSFALSPFPPVFESREADGGLNNARSPEKPKHRSLAEHLDAKAARKAERRQAKSADLYRLDSDSDAGSSSSDSDDGEPVPHFVDPDDEELEAMLRAHREKVGRGGTPDALLDSDGPSRASPLQLDPRGDQRADAEDARRRHWTDGPALPVLRGADAGPALEAAARPRAVPPRAPARDQEPDEEEPRRRAPARRRDGELLSQARRGARDHPCRPRERVARDDPVGQAGWVRRYLPGVMGWERSAEDGR